MSADKFNKKWIIDICRTLILLDSEYLYWMFFYFSNSYIKLFIKIEGMKSEESENNENPS